MTEYFKPKGVFPALITPFDKKQNLDEEAFKKLIEHVLPHVDGIVVAGTTGECAYLSLEERKRLFKIAVETVNGKLPVIAGTGEASTSKTLELTKYAEEIGAKAALIMVPYYLHPSDKGIHKHFLEITKKTNIPIILYNIPQSSDREFPRRVIEDLADVPQIVAVKDTSANLPYTMELIEFVGDRLNIIIGHDEVVLPALAGGCKGMILASAQVYPEHWQKVFKAVNENDLKTARETQSEIQKLSRIFCRYGGPVAVKSALNIMGVKVGTARKPLKIGGVLSNEDREEIRIELIKIGKAKSKEKDVIPESKKLEERFESMGLTADLIKSSNAFIGEGKFGEGKELVQIEVIAGPADGPIGEAYAYEMTHPRHGFEALTAILEPNLAVRPPTLLVPAIEQKTLRQANMIFGPAQVAISKAIVENVKEGIISNDIVNNYVMFARIFIPPLALNRRDLYFNNYKAMDIALKQAFRR